MARKKLTYDNKWRNSRHACDCLLEALERDIESKPLIGTIAGYERHDIVVQALQDIRDCRARAPNLARWLRMHGAASTLLNIDEATGTALDARVDAVVSVLQAFFDDGEYKFAWATTNSVFQDHFRGRHDVIYAKWAIRDWTEHTPCSDEIVAAAVAFYVIGDIHTARDVIAGDRLP